MKFRMLDRDELVHLEEEFKHFLIVNGIHSEEWEKMNIENSEKAIGIVGIFSDTVLQKVYEKLQYLEFRSTNSCMVFFVSEAMIHLISIQPNVGSDVDLSTPELIHHALKSRSSELQFFRSQKDFSKSREEEIHLLIEQGCFVSSQEFWNLLDHALN